LLHALALMRKRRGHRVVAVGIDHGLRREAGDELSLVEALAAAQEVPFTKISLRVKKGANLQARARKARHRALQSAAADHGASAVALGHTADDRAETLVMRLLRGSGPRGLAVMPVVSDGIEGDARLVRPLLAARRRDVIDHLGRHQLTSATDPSNRDARFLRVRVRREVMPLLEALSPGIVKHLCHLADQLADSRNAPPDALEGLNRAQLQALQRAIGQQRGNSTVRLSGGRDLRVEFFAGTPVVFVDQ